MVRSEQNRKRHARQDRARWKIVHESEMGTKGIKGVGVGGGGVAINKPTCLERKRDSCGRVHFLKWFI